MKITIHNESKQLYVFQAGHEHKDRTQALIRMQRNGNFCVLLVRLVKWCAKMLKIDSHLPQQFHSQVSIHEFVFFCLFVCLFFQGHTCGIWRFPGQGSNQSCSRWSTPIATAMPDPSCICDINHSSWQCWILTY